MNWSSETREDIPGLFPAVGTSAWQLLQEPFAPLFKPGSLHYVPCGQLGQMITSNILWPMFGCK